ncbi:single-stranded DNA-binding protein [Sphaerochaeta sp. S2]|uniref:single-stranded DNA-binding protein n=1 Tax=Sphaerochaeta sp. S2 TaxID=2798868 RepID=UPI0018E9768D|nr:single-stranded DNA-binding protein [Sphaerochaeta sp. S2]MBJ2357551.1 single-stranded DNA-binding protein [Sphaerochaeta sp. S2]
MNNLNSVLLEGNLVRDPERVELGENTSAMTKFAIAVNRFFRNAKAEAVEEVMFINVQAWGTLSKNCMTYLQKGRGVRGVGRLRQGRWPDKDGGNRKRILVVAEHVEFKKEPNTTAKADEREELDEIDQEIAF